MRALLIEDDATIADFIQRGMQAAGFTVDHAADGIDGLQLGLNGSYDVGIIALQLPGLDGLAVIERLCEREINMPVIVLSARRALDDQVQALQCGGNDYLIKPFAMSELLGRVRALLRRANSIVELTHLSIDDLSIDLLARTAVRNGKKIDLQPKEFALLEYLMRNEGHVVSKTMIMERVWNYNFDVQTNVIEARISKLTQKVDKGFKRPLIHTVRGLGYMLEKADL